jgi:hypothetical protein
MPVFLEEPLVFPEEAFWIGGNAVLDPCFPALLLSGIFDGTVWPQEPEGEHRRDVRSVWDAVAEIKIRIA